MATENIYQYMASLPVGEEMESIDALTVTATGLSGKLTISLILESMADILSVEKAVPFKFKGASGWSRGSVRYADKWDTRQNREWVILMVTGKTSERAYSVLSRISQPDVKVTRIDIAIDIKLRERVLGLCRRVKDSNDGRVNMSLVESLTGDTLYVGSRESDKMLRIYDKSSEYGEELGMVYRWELEAKGDTAPVIYEIATRANREELSDIVFGASREMGAPTPKYGVFPKIKSERITASSSEMKLNWLRNQVKPTVTWLRKLGLDKEVSDALGIENLTQGSFIDQNGEVKYTH